MNVPPPPDPRLLVLREYETFRIGRYWDSGNKTIGPAEIAAIEQLQARTGQSVVNLSQRTGQTMNWVGTLGLGAHTIEIVPKIDTSEGPLSAARTRANLLWMLKRSGRINLSPGDIAQVAGSGKPILAGFMERYLTHLAREWQRGPIRRYVSVDDDRPYLRGKLLVHQHLLRQALQPQWFPTRSDEWIEDNPPARLLKLALLACHRQSMDGTVAQRAARLLPAFDTVTTTPDLIGTMDDLVLDRTLNRFAPLFDMARLILRRQSPETGLATARTYVLLFDMNEVFERYVAAELYAALVTTPYTVRTQIGERSLLTRNGRPRFQLRPDIGLYQGGRLMALIDSKWKRLDPYKSHAGVTQADMYQVYAYGKVYNVPRTVVLYPRHGNLPERVASYQHVVPASNVPDQARWIDVRTADISSPLGTTGVRQKFLGELKQLAIETVSIDPIDR